MSEALEERIRLFERNAELEIAYGYASASANRLRDAIAEHLGVDRSYEGDDDLIERLRASVDR